jgi:hypothetical protein
LLLIKVEKVFKMWKILQIFFSSAMNKIKLEHLTQPYSQILDSAEKVALSALVSTMKKKFYNIDT